MINIISMDYPEILRLNITHAIKRLQRKHLEGLVKWLNAMFWHFFSLSIAVKLCRCPFRISENAKRDREMALMWERNRKFILGKPTNIGRSELIRRRFILNSALYHLQPQMMQMLHQCAAELEQARLQVIARGHLPIFAPFHTLSDALAGVVVTMTATKRTHVYSIYQDGYLGKEETAKLADLGLEVVHHHPAEPPAQQRVIFRELKSGKANIVIFPDALPQCTLGFLGYAMPSRRVTLFGRPASLHSGAEKIARIVGGKLIPFYLFWDDQQTRLSIRIFEPCSDGDLLTNCMEQALKEHGDQWPLWNYPSLFYFNDAGQ